MGRLPEQCDVAVVGGGPAGLAVATELMRIGVTDVIVLERESQAGGIPRHCGHSPFGVREFGRVYSGPKYARRLVDRATGHGVGLYTNTTVVSFGTDGTLLLATAEGIKHVQARRVVLATGVRETPRPPRLISGQRPIGITTTGALQSQVYLKGTAPFSRPLIVGTELVSFSALLTCRHAGIRPVAMLERNNRITARSGAALLPRISGIPVLLDARLERITGRKRVTGIDYLERSGECRHLECDGVVFTGQFTAEASLGRMGHLEMDPKSTGHAVDQFGRCSDPVYFATGNVLHPVETAGWCWSEGIRTAHYIKLDLAEQLPDVKSRIEIECRDPVLKYIVPQYISLPARQDGPCGKHYLQLRFSRTARGRLYLVSDSGVSWSGRVSGMPERRVLVPVSREVCQGQTGTLGLRFEETGS